MDEPRGVGIYMRDHGAMRPPKDAARVCQDNGVNFALLCAVWQEKGHERPINNLADLRRYADELRVRGIDVWLWGYPDAGMESAFVDRMHEAQKVTGAKGWLLDPEVSYKYKPALASLRKEQARNLVAQSINSLKEGIGFGVTSYGALDYHKNFPWEEFAVGFGSPQLYDVKPEEVNAALKSWGALFDSLVPSVPVYGPKSEANLDKYLQEFVDDPNEVVVHGFAFWSWPQVSKAEWKTIAKWSAFFDDREATRVLREGDDR